MDHWLCSLGENGVHYAQYEIKPLFGTLHLHVIKVLGHCLMSMEAEVMTLLSQPGLIVSDQLLVYRLLSFQIPQVYEVLVEMEDTQFMIYRRYMRVVCCCALLWVSRSFWWAPCVAFALTSSETTNIYPQNQNVCMACTVVENGTVKIKANVNMVRKTPMITFVSTFRLLTCLCVTRMCWDSPVHAQYMPSTCHYIPTRVPDKESLNTHISHMSSWGNSRDQKETSLATRMWCSRMSWEGHERFFRHGIWLELRLTRMSWEIPGNPTVAGTSPQNML